MVNPSESGSQFGLQNVCSRRTFLGFTTLASITGGLLMLAGCGPDMGSVSAAPPAEAEVQPPAVTYDPSCGGSSTVDQQVAIQSDIYTMERMGKESDQIEDMVQQTCQTYTEFLEQYTLPLEQRNVITR